MSKYNLIDIYEQYRIGSGWTNDFDYDGMLKTGLGTSIDTPIEVLKKISDDFEDVNYHRENSHLQYAIDAIEIGDMALAEDRLNNFHDEIRKTIKDQGMDIEPTVGQFMASKIKEGEEDNIEEMTRETFNRIDGLTNQNLKAQFLDKFSEIYEDMLEAGDLFDVSDVIDYLCTEMQAYAIDTKMDAGGMMEEEEIEEARPGYNDDGSPKSNDEMSDDEREAFYNDSDFIDEDESLKEHFGRFMKDYQ